MKPKKRRCLRKTIFKTLDCIVVSRRIESEVRGPLNLQLTLPPMGKLSSEHSDGLRSLGIQSPGRAAGDLLCDATDGKSTLVLLRNAWQQTCERSGSARLRQEAERNLELLSRYERQLEESWPEDDSRVPCLVRDWLNRRRWWWSGPLPSGRRVAIVSSRLPRRLDPHGSWLQALRAALIRAREQNDVLVVGQGTAGHELILHGAIRQRISTLRLRCCNPTPGEDWITHWDSSLGLSSKGEIVEGWALPLWKNSVESQGPSDNELQQIPERDRAPLAWADEIIVMGLRPHGNLHKLLRQRLALRPGSVFLADLPGLQPSHLRTELQELGALMWPLDQPISKATEKDSEVAGKYMQNWQSGMSATRRGSDVLPITSIDAVQFLTHATRACDGPWPGQSHDDYLESLFSGHSDSDHSALGTLQRIIQQRCLQGSPRAIRGGSAVVSFTAVPITELPRLRTFRAHRTRWDFEPYGLCIRQSWLEQRGCRPVHYGNEFDWEQLVSADRPFFQLAKGTSRSDSTPGTDWSVEREWRSLGSIDLSELSADDAVVFVPTIEEAMSLLPISPWSVTVLTAEPSDPAT